VVARAGPPKAEIVASAKAPLRTDFNSDLRN
jgi:hypothetical protein